VANAEMPKRLVKAMAAKGSSTSDSRKGRRWSGSWGCLVEAGLVLIPCCRLKRSLEKIACVRSTT
jgi:hypothetical protein